MSSMARNGRRVTVGVDTHRDTHVAAGQTPIAAANVISINQIAIGIPRPKTQAPQRGASCFGADFVGPDMVPSPPVSAQTRARLPRASRPA